MRANMTEIYESYFNWLVLCAFLFAIKSLLGAIALIADDSATALATVASAIGMLTTAILFVTAGIVLFRQSRLLWSLSGPADLKRRFRVREDGFTFDAIRSAAWFAFLITGTTLTVLDLVAEKVLLPAGFFLKLSLFIGLAVFSIAYWLINLNMTHQSGHEPA